MPASCASICNRELSCRREGKAQCRALTAYNPSLSITCQQSPSVTPTSWVTQAHPSARRMWMGIGGFLHEFGAESSRWRAHVRNELLDSHIPHDTVAVGLSSALQNAHHRNCPYPRTGRFPAAPCGTRVQGRCSLWRGRRQQKKQQLRAWGLQ